MEFFSVCKFDLHFRPNSFKQNGYFIDVNNGIISHSSVQSFPYGFGTYEIKTRKIPG